MSVNQPLPGVHREGEPPPGPPGTAPSPSSQASLTYAKALGGGSGGSAHLMKYAEIIAQQKTNRNVLEMKVKKIESKNKD